MSERKPTPAQLNENHDCSGPDCKRCKVEREIDEISAKIFLEFGSNPIAGTAVVAAGLAMLVAQGVIVERAIAVALSMIADMRETPEKGTQKL